jgi:hypothetical protein
VSGTGYRPQLPSFVPAKTIKEAEKFAEKIGAPKLPTTAKAAAQEKVNALSEIFEDIYLYGDEKEKVYKNWLKKFQNKKLKPFSDLDSEQFLEVQNAINHNYTNRKYRKIVDDLIPDHVTFSKPFEEGIQHAGEFIGGTSHIYESKWFEGLKIAVPQPGKVSSQAWGGTQAAIRHEYGHKIYDQLQRFHPEWRKSWQEKLHSIDDIGGKLTKYSKEKISIGDEAFSELFSLVTDENYNPANFSDDIVKLGDFILKKIKATKWQRK